MDPNTGKGGKGPLWEGTKNFTGRREREGRNGNGKEGVFWTVRGSSCRLVGGKP